MKNLITIIFITTFCSYSFASSKAMYLFASCKITSCSDFGIWDRIPATHCKDGIDIVKVFMERNGSENNVSMAKFELGTSNERGIGNVILYPAIATTISNQIEVKPLSMFISSFKFDTKFVDKSISVKLFDAVNTDSGSELKFSCEYLESL